MKDKWHRVSGAHLAAVHDTILYLTNFSDPAGRNVILANRLKNLLNTTRQYRQSFITIECDSEQQACHYFERVEGLSHHEDIVSIVDRRFIRIETDYASAFVETWFTELESDLQLTVERNPHL